MLYISAALPRYRSQSTTKPGKNCDFTQPERLASVNREDVGKGKGRGTEKAELPTGLAQTEPAQPSSASDLCCAWSEGCLPRPCLSVNPSVPEGQMEVHSSDCPKIKVFEKLQRDLISKISPWLLGAQCHPQ